MHRLGAIVNAKCPRCREGDMFETSAYKLSSFHKMFTNCQVCKLKFEREPGFFVGAMYVNYAFSVALIVAVGIALTVFNLYTLFNFVLTIVSLVILLLPFLFRYSRVLFLHVFGDVDFDPEAKSIKP